MTTTNPSTSGRSDKAVTEKAEEIKASSNYVDELRIPLNPINKTIDFYDVSQCQCIDFYVYFVFM